MGISVRRRPAGGDLARRWIPARFAAMSQDRVEALIVDNVQENLTNRRVIVELAERARLPAMFPWRDHVELGGLMAYVPDWADLYRHAAQQVGQILKGAKPGNIPIYRVTRFGLILNLRTARALGLTFPRWMHAVADEIFE